MPSILTGNRDDDASTAEPPRTAEFRLKHIPALDGVRALAFLLVYIFHCRVPGTMRSGFIGVDLFFVLSGFLITSLLLQEYRRSGSISLSSFYIRRALRLLPAAFVMVAVFLLVSYFFFPWKRFVSNLEDSALMVFYVANLRPLFVNRPSNWLAHAWSLSLEEQFYLCWPVIVLFLLRRVQDLRQIRLVLLAGICLSWALRIALYNEGATYYRVYHGLDTRGDSLLVGALLSVQCFLHPLAPRARLWSRLGVISLVVLLGMSFVGRDNEFWVMWGFTIVAVASAFLILSVVAGERTRMHVVFEIPAITWIGKISYGLYLWHYPIIRIMRHLKLDWITLTALSTPLTFLFACASYYFVEKRFLALKDRLAARTAPSPGEVTAARNAREEDAPEESASSAKLPFDSGSPTLP